MKAGIKSVPCKKMCTLCPKDLAVETKTMLILRWIFHKKLIKFSLCLLFIKKYHQCRENDFYIVTSVTKSDMQLIYCYIGINKLYLQTIY